MHLSTGFLLLLLVVSACGDCDSAAASSGADAGPGPDTTTTGAHIDSDGDGISDEDELAMNTDPSLADSDGDGIVDGGELILGTDPTRGDEPCGKDLYTAQLEDQPVDIIFVIDNSSSMDDELISVESNINESFTKIIGDSGVDYRVIMISSHAAPEDNHICISEPLSGTTCSPRPENPVNGARFFHYDLGIDSKDSFRKMLDSWDQPDMHGFAPDGWRQWLREDAFKVIIEFTDDRSGDPLPDGAEPTAANFERALMQLEPSQFGTPGFRNYIFHSIVGLAAKDPADQPWHPDEPLLNNTCRGAVEPGVEYQKLSVITGGLRYPVCNFRTYDAVFEAAAQGIIEQSRLRCEVSIPEVPDGELADTDAVMVQYEDATGKVRLLDRTTAGQCDARSYYLSGNTITLCPAVCAEASEATRGELIVAVACGGTVAECEPEGPYELSCDDGVDNDCDGFVDRSDVECIL